MTLLIASSAADRKTFPGRWVSKTEAACPLAAEDASPFNYPALSGPQAAWSPGWTPATCPAPSALECLYQAHRVCWDACRQRPPFFWGHAVSPRWDCHQLRLRPGLRRAGETSCPLASVLRRVGQGRPDGTAPRPPGCPHRWVGPCRVSGRGARMSSRSALDPGLAARLRVSTLPSWGGRDWRGCMPCECLEV